jgi:hypothetical protein
MSNESHNVRGRLGHFPPAPWPAVGSRSALALGLGLPRAVSWRGSCGDIGRRRFLIAEVAREDQFILLSGILFP